MYFFRRYYPNCQYRVSSPSACGQEKVTPMPVQTVCLKTVSSGGATFSGFPGTDNVHELILLNLEIRAQANTAVDFCFACNLTFLRSGADISFQLLRSGPGGTVPLATSAIYRRSQEYSGSDAICFHTQDCDLPQNCSCSYLIRMYSACKIPEDGMVSVTNPILTAIIL